MSHTGGTALRALTGLCYIAGNENERIDSQKCLPAGGNGMAGRGSRRRAGGLPHPEAAVNAAGAGGRSAADRGIEGGRGGSLPRFGTAGGKCGLGTALRGLQSTLPGATQAALITRELTNVTNLKNYVVFLACQGRINQVEYAPCPQNVLS